MNLFVSTSGQSQPSELEFNLEDIEVFRYRVEDVKRAVTRAAVKNARVEEVKREIVNSGASSFPVFPNLPFLFPLF